MPVLPSYRNQSIDLQSKSIDWFLYKGNTGTSLCLKRYFTLQVVQDTYSFELQKDTYGAATLILIHIAAVQKL